MVDKKVPLERVFLRNRVLMNQTKDLPAKVVVKNEMKVVPQNDYNLDGVFAEKSIYEVYCIGLLHNITFMDGDRQVSLDQVLRDPRVDRNSIYRQLQEQLKDFDLFSDSVGVQLVNSKKYCGVVGSTCYGDFSSITESLEKFTRAAIDIIFGKDEFGKYIDKVTLGLQCPNILDMTDEDTFKTVLEMFKVSGPRFSSAFNYFKCRSMDYIAQTMFIRVGLVCGKVTPSLVKRELGNHKTGSNKLLLQKLGDAPDWDMVILNSRKMELLYLMQPQFEQYVTVCKSESSDEALRRVGGILVKIRG